MFRIPSKVRAELLRSGTVRTSRYKYVLVDATGLADGLYFCDRYPLVCSHMFPGLYVPREDLVQRRVL